MRVLGIETSCDETAAAVVECDHNGQGRILSSVVLSQIDDHAPYGGVVPEIAARAHVEVLDRLIGQARLTFGLTFSTYGDDAFGAGAGAQQRYSPGKRFIGEASFMTPGLGGMVTAYAWDYFRAAGDTAGISTGNRENILIHPADITGKGAPQAIVAAAVAAFGGLDILFNNAGVSGRASVEELTEEEWDRVNGVNVRAQFLLAREAIPHLKKSPARYYVELRLNRARLLLLQTNMSVIDIALACGFVSASHFSKCYRDFFGKTPRRERAGPVQRSAVEAPMLAGVE